MPPAFPLQPDVIPPRSGSIVILTGAGISKESGLETFRDAGGIWSQVRLEDVATPEAFARDPVRVHAFYNMRRARHRTMDIKPNAAHHAVVKLQQAWPGGVTVVTQNVDTLHDEAGTKDLIHMHGTYAQARCNFCDAVVPRLGDLSVTDICASCGKDKGMRPNVVWFGEVPLHMERITAALRDCALFISIGTSGSVYPAAGFVTMVKRSADAHTVELNLEPSQGATLFAEAHYGPATQIVPAYVESLLQSL